MMIAAVTGQRSQLQTNTYALAMPIFSASQNPALPPAVRAEMATRVITAPPMVIPNATASVFHHGRDSLTS